MESFICKIIKFNSSEELSLFETDFKEYQELKQKKKIEKRGSKTAQLHKKVKEYLLEHNDLSYKDCLKIVGKEITNNNNKNITNKI